MTTKCFYLLKRKKICVFVSLEIFSPIIIMAPSITVFADLQIEQLQLHLQQEKSMRIMLDRAMGRASSTLSPGHRHFAAQVTLRLIYT
jgi:hypothetical protein